MFTYYLTKTELEIMQYLWSIDREATAREIRDHFSNKNWSKQTVYSFLKNLVKAGFLSIRKVSVTKYFYSIQITKQEYDLLPAKKIVDDSFNGSYSKFICDFIEPNNLSLKELDEIQEMIDHKRQILERQSKK